MIKALAEGAKKEASKAVEKAKASVRAFVEHSFHLVKNLFGYRKVRDRGLAKNEQLLYTLFGLARDETVGWDAVTRSQCLKLVVQLRRFLVLEATRRPNPASQCLGAGLHELVGQ